MPVQFEISQQFSAAPDILYNAWLNSAEHSNMTGGTAEVSETVGGKFNAWDGYIDGVNLELDPGKRILQSWHTTEFDDSDPDSLLLLLFTPSVGGTLLTLKHSNLPGHGMQYKQGWVDAYFIPMLTYFG